MRDALCLAQACLSAIAIFYNEVKGKSALALARDLGVSYKAVFVICHKLREAMVEEFEGPHGRRRGQGRQSRWRLFRRLYLFAPWRRGALGIEVCVK